MRRRKLTRCYWCDRGMLRGHGDSSPLSATRDHVQPRSRGGGWVVWACWQCNNIKGDMAPGEWAAFRARNPRWWALDGRRPGGGG